MTINSIHRAAWKRGFSGPSERRQATADLWNSFPCLKDKECGGIKCAFDADSIRKRMGVWSSGECICAQFVLSVWNPLHFKFDIQEVSGVSDVNRFAMADWLLNPWWP